MLKKMLGPLVALSVVALSSTAHAQVYTGHNSAPRLRGYNAGAPFLSTDYAALAASGANVVRYQLLYTNTWPGAPSSPPQFGGPSGDISSADLATYHSWLTWEVTNSGSDLNTFITGCAKYNIKVLIDQHQPPGGVPHYLDANGKDATGPDRIFLYQDCLTEFVNDWGLIAKTYAGNPTIWGYDLCNEPNDGTYAGFTPFLNWTNAFYLAAKQVRQYDNLDVNNVPNGPDSQHALIVEPSSGGWAGLSGIPTSGIPGVVYSFHTYGDYTWYSGQDDDAVGTRVWPDTTPDGQMEADPSDPHYNPNGFTAYDWTRHDITYLYNNGIAAARAFQLANNCKIFVGEFGTVRWSPGAGEYISEMISYFESYGWDWTYVGYRADVAGDGTWNGFDSEAGLNFDTNAQKGTLVPEFPKTDQKTVLTSWFANDVSPVSNFNFLNPSLGTGFGAIAPSPAAAPWNFGIAAGLAGNGSAFSNPDSIPGTQCAYLQSTSWGTGLITQPVQWTPNTSYTVSFSAANRVSYAPQTVNVYVGGTVSNGTLSGGTLVGSITPLTTSWDTYTTPPFTVGQGSIPVTQLLSFVGTPTTGDQTAFLDSIAVSKQAPPFLPLGSAWLTGTNINDGFGSGGNLTATALAASDGNTSTYYNCAQPSGGWTGIDLGAGKTATLTHVYFYPRSDNAVAGADYAASMDGGVFQGTNDPTFTNWTTLATVNNEGPQWGQATGARIGELCQIPVTVSGASPYRYFRYLGPPNSHCNVAEVRFYGNSASIISDGTPATSANPPQAAFDGNYFTNFESTKTSGGGWTGIDLGPGNTAVMEQVSFSPDSTPSKMVGGVFQGTNDTTLNTWQTLAAITSTPTPPTKIIGAQWTTITLPTPNPNPPVVAYPNAYRFFRYYNSVAQNAGVGEIQFYGNMTHVLTGTNINDAWGSGWGNPPTNAFDGSTTTRYNSYLGKYGWTGIDVGPANPAVVTCIRFYPDSSWGGGPTQMIGGVFQGSNDGTSWTNLTSPITTAPKLSAWTSVAVTGAVPYRYLRYFDNGNGSNWCDVAEVQFIGY